MAISVRSSTQDQCSAAAALENYVAYFKLSHGSIPRPQTLERIGLSLGMRVVDPKRILENADRLAEQMRGTIVEQAAKNGDVETAMSCIGRFREIEKHDSPPPATPAPSVSPSEKSRFDPLLLIAYPFAIINGLCAFILMAAFNICIAIKKTIKGEPVR